MGDSRSKSAARSIPVLSDDAELIVDAAHLAERLGLDASPTLAADPIAETLDALAGGPTALVLARVPTTREIAQLASCAARAQTSLVLALTLDDDDARAALTLAGDLGAFAVSEIRPMLAVLAILASGAPRPFTPSLRTLPASDRARVGVRGAGSTSGGKLARADEGTLCWSPAGRGKATLLGEPADVGVAIRAMDAASGGPAGRAIIEGVDERAVGDVLFGPPRALSDPASKAALAPYGLPTPVEELCTSPSRAAAEASRMGFPVRIALASPDLRIWDHPDLAVEGVDNASRVREVFRTIMGLATERSHTARLLGVTVTATTPAIARLSILARPLVDGLVHAEIGFADPHGSAAADRTETILPLTSSRLEAVLARLRGEPLLRGTSSASRRALVEDLADTLLRVAAFVDRHSDALVSVELRPLAILLGGGVEVREACVTVGDHYLRTLEPAATG